MVAEKTVALAHVGETSSVYPPARTGWRGNHVGSFEAAHDFAHRGRRDSGTPREPDADVYDLVVVGGGISGLAAAHFHRKREPNARILILDNHDDFGGHAKRNEFQVGGRTPIGYGGSQTLSEPSGYSEVVKRLLADLRVERLEKISCVFGNARLDSSYPTAGGTPPARPLPPIRLTAPALIRKTIGCGGKVLSIQARSRASEPSRPGADAAGTASRAAHRLGIR